MVEIRAAAEFLAYFQRVRGRTDRVIRCIPPEHIEWTHKPGAFTFGDIVRHLGAMERYMFAENVRGKPSIYPGHGHELADGYEQVLDFFARMHAESVAIFEELTPDDLVRKCETPAGVSLPTWKWLRAMIEHEVHHRGQIYLMLGMLGVPAPPLYGLTSEEVRERSRSD